MARYIKEEKKEKVIKEKKGNSKATVIILSTVIPVVLVTTLIILLVIFLSMEKEYKVTDPFQDKYSTIKINEETLNDAITPAASSTYKNVIVFTYNSTTFETDLNSKMDNKDNYLIETYQKAFEDFETLYSIVSPSKNTKIYLLDTAVYGNESGITNYPAPSLVYYYNATSTTTVPKDYQSQIPNSYKNLSFSITKSTNQNIPFFDQFIEYAQKLVAIS